MPVPTLDQSRLEDRVSTATLAKMKFMSGSFAGMNNVVLSVTVNGQRYNVVFDDRGQPHATLAEGAEQAASG